MGWGECNRVGESVSLTPLEEMLPFEKGQELWICGGAAACHAGSIRLRVGDWVEASSREEALVLAEDRRL